MTLKELLSCLLAVGLVAPVMAEDPAPAETDAAATEESAEPERNVELEFEIAYVTALVDSGYPDFAEPVIKATVAKWPESEVQFFAIDVERLLTLGKFDEAEKLIASLPDRKSAKYWAARLKLANFLFSRKKKDECTKIYEEFFKTFPNPPKELMPFYLNASYEWGQIQIMDGNYLGAAKTYEELLKRGKALTEAHRCMISCDACEQYIRLATAEKNLKTRNDYLLKADKLTDYPLDHTDQALYFCRALAMKAHSSVMRGNVSEAQELIEEYMPTLAQLHENIVAADPDGRQGIRKMSPLPQCRFLMAEMLWKEAKDTYEKPPEKGKKRDDEAVKAFMFGAKLASGKRNGQGAYNHALNVFLKYPESTWAAAAGKLADEIENFAIEKYGAKIAKKVTPEMLAQVRATQWREARDRIDEGDREGGIASYLETLGQYPELEESISAIEAVITAYLDLILGSKDEAKKADWRLDADSIEGYLAERFAAKSERKLVIMAGDAVNRLAGKEKERGNVEREKELRKLFAKNFVIHPNAPGVAVALADSEQKAGNWQEAIDDYLLLTENYTNSQYYAGALMQMSVCYDKLGDAAKSLDYLKEYVKAEPKAANRLAAQINLAQKLQKRGFELLTENETEGSKQIIKSIQQFIGFSTETAKLIADPNTSAEEKAQYTGYRDAAMFLVGESWMRLKRPEAKVEAFRQKAAEAMEAYLKEYPDGKYAKPAYVKLSMLYTIMGDAEKSKAALDRLTAAYPDSEEAKNAKPALAKSLVEMGKDREAAQIYAEMLRTDGAYTARQFLQAGETLIDAKSWELSNQAFEKAIRLAGTNEVTVVAKARIGEAKSLYKQKQFVEAREAIDLFLADEKMAKMSIAADAQLLMVEVASEQGRTEKDDVQRGKDFGAAVGALKKLRAYWAKKPLEEQDQIDLMSADVVISRMRAEEAMGLKEQAADTRAKAAAMLQFFLQSRLPADEEAFNALNDGAKANLERALATVVPLFTEMGAEQSERVMKFGGAYLKFFPAGKAATEVGNCMNRAKADIKTEVKNEVQEEVESK